MNNKLLALVMLCTTPVIQATALPHLPDDLLFMKKPIDSYCFAELDESISTIQLNDCGHAKANLTIKNNKNDYLIQKNFIGYDWIDKHNQNNGFTYYQVLPAGQHKFWIYTLNNGGGTGNFTSIYLYTRISNNLAQVKSAVAGGDRCNGGIEEVQLKNSKLHYSISLTAADIIFMSKENLHVKAYDDIAACASCCFAKGVYEMDTTLTPILQYVDFGKKKDMVSLSEQGLYQKCFNRLFSSYVVHGKTKLNNSEITKFADEFNKQCVLQHKKDSQTLTR